jgi:rfaE bifunctional protein kinase chain/domain
MNFEGLTIGIVGDVMIDSYLWGNVDRISPEAPIPVVAVTSRESRLGGAGNVALNVKSLGASPLLFSVIGNDPDSGHLSGLLEEHKIDAVFVRSTDRVTTVKTRVLSRNHQMFRYDSESTHAIQSSEEDELIELIATRINAGDLNALILQDYNKGILTPKVIRQVIDLCNEAGIPTAVDPKRLNFMAYSQCTLFKPNLKEVQEGMGMEVNATDPDSLLDAANKIHAEFDNRFTLFTLADEGVFFSEKGKGEHIPAHKRNVSDVSGAGDTVISVATVALAAGLSGLEMASIANIAGGLVCEYVGVVPVDREQLERETARILDE